MVFYFEKIVLAFSDLNFLVFVSLSRATLKQYFRYIWSAVKESVQMLARGARGSLFSYHSVLN